LTFADIFAKIRGMTVKIGGKTYRITNVEMRGHVCDKWRKIDLADPQVQLVAQKCAELFSQVNPGSGKTISFSFDMTSSGLIRKQYHVLLKQIKVDDKTHDVSDPDQPHLQGLSNTLGLPFMLWLNKPKSHPGHPAPAPLPPKPVPSNPWATDDDSEDYSDEPYIYLASPVKKEVADAKVEEVFPDVLAAPIDKWANHVAQPKPVGNLGGKWQFPSDHLPVGIECNEARFASWNVLNKEFMQHITDNKQGLLGSMITDLHASKKRDEHVCALTQEMSSRVDLIAEQECSVPYLNHLQNNLPKNWELIRSSDQPYQDQVALMYNKSKFHFIKSETLYDTMPSAPGRPVQRVTLQDRKTGHPFDVINGHIPGGNTLPARQEFANFVKKSSRSNATTVVLGDNNFLRNEMITAYGSAGLANYSLHSPWNTIVDNNKSSKCIDHICVQNGKARNLAPLELMSKSSNLESTVNLLN
jgi:hypothetical protein